MQSGNPDALLDATSRFELGCSNLDRTKLARVWQLLIQPIISRSRMVGEAPAQLSSNQVQASASTRHVDGAGSPWALTITANQTDDGPKTLMVYPMLALASMFDAGGNTAGELTSELALRGVRRHRRSLENLGIHKVLLRPGVCITWDQLESKLE